MKGFRGFARKGRNGEVENYTLIVQASNIENAGDLPEVGADTDGVALCVAHDGTLRRTLWSTLLAWILKQIRVELKGMIAEAVAAYEDEKKGEAT